MDDQQTSNENPPTDFNKLDLSQLQGFSFGTQWTQDKGAPSRNGGDRDRPPRRSNDRADRPRRDRDAGGEPRRDRRDFRKPDSDNGPAAPAGPSAERQPARPDRRQQGDRPPRREYREGDRRDNTRQGGHREPARREPLNRGPYISPYYNVTFYPDDTGLEALVKAIRASCRTYELFEVARVVIGKNDRFVATIRRKQPDEAKPQQGSAGVPPADEGRPDLRQANPRQAGPRHDRRHGRDAGRIPSADETPALPESAPAAAQLPPLAISVPDGLVFDNEETAIAHVIGNHLGNFFDTAEVEVEPPKGNFQVINKCGITGELLGPPNYHRYNQIVQRHYATRVSRMGFEAFRARIETIRDPEVVNQWLEKMKKTTRYTWKLAPRAARVPRADPDDPAPADSAAPAEAAKPITFDTLEEARDYLLENARGKVSRLVGTARMSGKLIEKLPHGEIRRAIESTLDRQRRFPLDTSNALRGRLRREGFAIYKKGPKGITYACAVKRQFRVPGQAFADSIGALIAFIEANPMIKASELPAKFFGIPQPAETPAAAVTPAPAPETEPSQTEQTDPPDQTNQSAQPAHAPADTTASPAPATSGSVAPFAATTAALSAEDQSKLHRLAGDLRWLVSEGYVTEFADGRLFAPAAMTEARKREVEQEEQDLENFPEAPDAAPVAPAAPGTAPDETIPADSSEATSSTNASAEEAEAVVESTSEPEPAPAPEVVPDTEPMPASDPAEPAPAPEEASVQEPQSGSTLDTAIGLCARRGSASGSNGV